MILPKPRAYVDWTCPVDRDGNEIGVCTDTETFDFYIDWLADYLYETDIFVPECQQADLKEFQGKGGISDAVFWTSDYWGLSIWDVEDIETCYTDSVSFDEYHKMQVDYWESMDEDEKELYDNNPDEDFYLSEADFNRICREKKESLKVPPYIRHADVPYRPIFATLMKSVHEKVERVKHLKSFYMNFDECVRK